MSQASCDVVMSEQPETARPLFVFLVALDAVRAGDEAVVHALQQGLVAAAHSLPAGALVSKVTPCIL